MRILRASACLLLLVAAFSCKEKEGEDQAAIALVLLAALTPPITDDALYAESADRSSLSIFPNTPSTPFNSGIANRPHGDAIRVLVNATGLAAIDSAQKRPKDGVFPSGSLIVKERYSGGSVVQLIPMKRHGGTTGAGWFWAEYSTAGAVQYSVNLNGAGCTGCHYSPGKDYVRIFEY